MILILFTKISVNNPKASTKKLLGLESELKRGLKIQGNYTKNINCTSIYEQKSI